MRLKFLNILEAAELEQYLGMEEDSIMKAIATSNRASQDKALDEITRDVPLCHARDIENMASRIMDLYSAEAQIKSNAAERWKIPRV